jgi:hypothetical protein
MRRIAISLALLIAALAAAASIAACGGGESTDPEDAIAAAGKHRDQLEGELMLAEVELEKAFLAEDEKEAVDKPRQAASGISRVLRAAQRIEHECREGNGLESCTEIDSIEEVVAEIEADARVGPSR